MRGVVLRALNLGYRASLRPAWARFQRAASDPEAAQAARLQSLLDGARGTAFAREHGLEAVRTLADYRSAVPVRDYEGLEPWVERVRAGEPGVLTRETPVAFERSSGSTRGCKYIPYTRRLLAEFAAATGPWLHDLLSSYPGMAAGSSYWSISPLAREPETTPGGIRVGFEDDTEYFPAPVRRLLRVLLPVPSAVARLPDVASCRHATLLYLMADPRLAFVSVWSPSFLTLLLDHAREHAERLALDLERGTLRPPGVELPEGLLRPPRADPARAEAVRRAYARGGEDLGLVWPRLALVSCWTDGAAARLVPELRRRLPRGVALQGKGLLATEGVVSFPLAGQEGGVLALASHLLELEPADEPHVTPVSPGQAEEGRRYLPVLSTGGGLYRYRLGDVVEVVGRHRLAPRVRFLGKADGGSDLAGEKLTAGRVGAVLDEALAACGVASTFAMLAPEDVSPPRYVLYLEAAPGVPPETVARAVEEGLSRGHHYAYCRRLGQLGPVEAAAVRGAALRYERALVARGMRAGDIKPTPLHPGGFWREAFGLSSPGPARYPPPGGAS